MGKPSIGDAVIPEMKEKNKKEVKELTVVEKDSKESIYNLIFLHLENDGAK